MRKKNPYILVTGGNGRFASIMKKKLRNKKNYVFLNKKKLNILSRASIRKNILKYNPKTIIHLAALSRPMNQHEENIQKSIKVNIIGTSNLVIECSKEDIKLVHFSTQYVYPGRRGNYSETSPLLPMNNYAWSKLGGESAVQMYKNSLILRVAMYERPWLHKFAYKNIFSNYLYHDEVVKILPRVLSKRGILNIGSGTKSIVSFAKKTKKDVQIVKYKQIKSDPKVPVDSSINIKKLKKILKRI